MPAAIAGGALTWSSTPGLTPPACGAADDWGREVTVVGGTHLHYADIDSWQRLHDALLAVPFGRSAPGECGHWLLVVLTDG